MFSLFAPVKPKPVAIVKTPETAVPNEEYRALVKKLGLKISYGPTRSERFEAFLQQEGIGVYPVKSVRRYLNRSLRKDRSRIPKGCKKVWVWKPIEPGQAYYDQGQDVWIWGGSGHRMHSFDVYDKPIPYPVLLTIEKIRNAFGPAEVAMYISDYEVVRPDPFLLAVVADNKQYVKQYVIERWDEPSFRS